MSRQVLVATRNPGKIQEFREILGSAGFDLITPEEAGWTENVVEDGETLAANAAKKARAAAAATGLDAVSDDTGLFVEALDGAPGVHSARYAGADQNPRANCAKLLDALRGREPSERAAAFRCVVALAAPGGEVRLFEGEIRGRIATEPRGSGGFGYDPVFEVEATGRTFAEMPVEEKNMLSHRGRALKRLQEHLQRQPDPIETEESR